MSHEEKFLLILAGIIIILFLVEVLQITSAIELPDFGGTVSAIIIFFGLLAGYMYARTGEIYYLLLSTIVVVAFSIGFFEIPFGWSGDLVIFFTWVIFIGLILLRLSYKRIGF